MSLNNTRRDKSSLSCAKLFTVDYNLYRKAYRLECMIDCECGARVNKYNIKTHTNTYKHKYGLTLKNMLNSLKEDEPENNQN